MLHVHTKFRRNGSTASRENVFEGCLTIYWRGIHFGHVTQMPETNFRYPSLRRLHTQFGFDWPRGFGDEDV